MPTYKVTDPATNQTLELTGDSPPNEQELEEVFGTMKIGGTKQPTGAIDTRSNEPITEYVPRDDPGAGFGTMLKNVFVDDPKKQIEIYAEARGIPASRYRIHNGEIIFRNKAGKWQRESGEGVADVGKRAAAQLANPAVIGGVAGSVLGPKGAIAGAAGGEVVRQAIGAGVYGDFESGVDNVRKAYTEGVLALGGEIVGGVIKGAVHGHRLAKTGMKNAAWSVRVANFTPEDHLKAELVRNVAQRHGIDLPMHQVYDKESLSNLWMYLRKHPQTADIIKGVEDRISKQGDEAIQAFTRELRGPGLEGPAEIGEQAKKAATGAIKEAEEQRGYAVQPMYDEGFKEADLNGGIDLTPAVRQLDQLIESYNKGPAQKILQSVKQKLGTEEKVAAGPKLAKGWNMTEEEAGGAWRFRSFVKKLGGIAIDDPDFRGEVRDIAKGARWAPGVVSSRGKGGNFMDELVAKIKESGLWTGLIEDQDDVLRALADNISNESVLGKSVERQAAEHYAKMSSVTDAGREWKAANTARKTPEPPKSVFTPETDLRKIQKALFEINDIIEGTAHEAAQISPSSKNVLTRELMSLKSQILEQINHKAPTFIEANAKYAELSEPIDRLKNSVVGEISRLQKDATTAEATAKLFDMGKMKDPELLWRARASIEPQDPELWRRMLGSYIRDTYDKLVIQEGDPISAFGKFERKLFGSPKQREIMEAAMGRDLYREFSGLMDVLKRATAGTRGQSMTAQFLAMEREMAPVSGSKLYQLGVSAKRTAIESVIGNWNDAILRGRQSQLLEAMLSDQAIEQMKNMKKLSPGSQKLIDALGVYTSMVLLPIGAEESYDALAGYNRMPQEQSGSQGRRLAPPVGR